MIQERHYAAQKTVGARPYQEDDCGFYVASAGTDGGPEGLLMVLADGMGGHRGGEEASRIAVETFIHSFNDREDDVETRLEEALRASNIKIGEVSEARPELEGMGCTLVGAFLNLDRLYWISVGDSPLWLIRNGKMKRINEDHSMTPVLEEQVRAGIISREDAAGHPQRNALRAAVMGDALALVDGPNTTALRNGDRLLLASDGVHTLADSEIVEIVKGQVENQAQLIVDRLVAEIEARGAAGQDNATAMVVLVEGQSNGSPVRTHRSSGVVIASGFGLIALAAAAYLLLR